MDVTQPTACSFQLSYIKHVSGKLKVILILCSLLLIYRFENVLSIEPQNARAASNIALIYLDLQNMKKSEEMFLKTLQIDPTYRSTLYNLGVLYNRQRRYTEAVELLGKLASLYPDHLNGVQLLGDCYLRLQQQKKAEEMYRLVLRQNPNHTTALHNLGQLQSMKACEGVYCECNASTLCIIDLNSAYKTKLVYMSH